MTKTCNTMLIQLLLILATHGWCYTQMMWSSNGRVESSHYALTEPEVMDLPKEEVDDSVTLLKRRALEVSSEISLPFSAETAFDAFADLNRQPEWSPWLHSVEYIELDSQLSEYPATEWTLKVLGMSYSWTSIATKQDRPHLIEWESVSGLKNFGRVQFEPMDDGGCYMTMTMSFVPPKFVATVFRNPRGIRRFMERKLIGSSLNLFRDVIVESTVNALTSNTTMIFLPV